MNDTITPPRGPAHQCINANCGCNDLVTGGPCSAWCAEHGVEAADVERGKTDLAPCDCGHATCRAQMPARTGERTASAERGVA